MHDPFMLSKESRSLLEVAIETNNHIKRLNPRVMAHVHVWEKSLSQRAHMRNHERC